MDNLSDKDIITFCLAIATIFAGVIATITGAKIQAGAMERAGRLDHNVSTPNTQLQRWLGIAFRGIALVLLMSLVFVAGRWWGDREPSELPPRTQVASITPMDETTSTTPSFPTILTEGDTLSPTATLPPAATSTATTLSSTDPSIELSTQPTQPLQSRFLVDLGETASESQFDLQGWGPVETQEDGTIASTSGDYSLRNMRLRADNTLTFANLAPGDYTLIAEVGDGYCDDSFEILVVSSATAIYSYTAIESEYVSFGPNGQHEVQVPGEFIEGSVLTVTFRNRATDSCGLATVYNIVL